MKQFYTKNLWVNDLYKIEDIEDKLNYAAEKVAFVAQAFEDTQIYVRFHDTVNKNRYCAYTLFKSTVQGLQDILIMMPIMDVRINRAVGGNAIGIGLFIGNVYDAESVYDNFSEPNNTYDTVLNFMDRFDYHGLEFTPYNEVSSVTETNPDNGEIVIQKINNKKLKVMSYYSDFMLDSANTGVTSLITRTHKTKCFMNLVLDAGEIEHDEDKKPFIENYLTVASYVNADRTEAAISLYFSECLGRPKTGKGLCFQLTFGTKDGCGYSFGLRNSRLNDDTSVTSSPSAEDQLFCYCDYHRACLVVSSITEYLINHSYGENSFYGKAYVIKPDATGHIAIRVDSKVYRPFYYKDARLLNSGDLSTYVNGMTMVCPYIGVEE